jgi:hypothetical protein
MGYLDVYDAEESMVFAGSRKRPGEGGESGVEGVFND